MTHPILFEQPPAPTPFFPDSAFSTKEPAARAALPSTPDLDPPGANQPGLSRQEIERFRESGYVIKRGLIPEEVLAPLVDLWWQQPPVQAAGMKRDDPGTWRAPSLHWPEQNRWGLVDNWMGDRAWPGYALSGWPGVKGQRGELVVRLPYRLTEKGRGTNDVWRWHGQRLPDPSIGKFPVPIIEHDASFNARPEPLVEADFLHPALVISRCVESIMPVARIRFCPDVDQAFAKGFPGHGGITIDIEADGIEIVTTSIERDVLAPVVRVAAVFDVPALFKSSNLIGTAIEWWNQRRGGRILITPVVFRHDRYVLENHDVAQLHGNLEVNRQVTVVYFLD